MKSDKINQNTTKFAREFHIGDIVIADRGVEKNEYNDVLLEVVGYQHDRERLYVVDPTDRINNGQEFEMCFAEVIRHWRELTN